MMVMNFQSMCDPKSQEKGTVRLATIDEHSEWVTARAREVDLEKEIDLVRELDAIMRNFRNQYSFVGVSSNNIYWMRTKTPIRQILIPYADAGYASVVNPDYVALEGKDVSCLEACGSIPGEIFVVKRKSHVVISGYTVGGKHIQLEFKAKECASHDLEDNPVWMSFSNKAWIVQHEMDHLDGITLRSKGVRIKTLRNLHL